MIIKVEMKKDVNIQYQEQKHNFFLVIKGELCMWDIVSVSKANFWSYIGCEKQKQNKIKYLSQMTQQVTKDLLWKRGRVPRACSWRWWGTGRRPDWWWSQACPRRSRWKKAMLREGTGSGLHGLDTGGNLVPRQLIHLPALCLVTEMPQGCPCFPDSRLC